MELTPNTDQLGYDDHKLWWPNARILLAEDHMLNQLVVIGMLERFGIEECNIDIVESGKAAILRSGETDYDLILMDVQMPLVDGLTATKAIRDRERLQAGTARKHVNIVAMTAHSMTEHREQCLASGMDDYLSKPISIQAVTKVLRQYLSKSQTVKTDPFDNNLSQSLVGQFPSRLDTKQLAAASGGDTLLEDRILGEFVHTNGDIVAQCESMIEIGDAPGLERLAHYLKGSCWTVGASELGDLCDKIEKFCSKGQISEAATYVSAIKRNWQELSVEIELYLYSRCGVGQSKQAEGRQRKAA